MEEQLNEGEDVGWFPGFGPSASAKEIFVAVSGRYAKLVEWGIRAKLPRLRESLDAVELYQKQWSRGEAELSHLSGFKGDVQKLEREAAEQGYKVPTGSIERVDVESSSAGAAVGVAANRELAAAANKVVGANANARTVYDAALARYLKVLQWGARDKLPFLKETFAVLDKYRTTWENGNADLTALSNWKNDVQRVEKYAAEHGYTIPSGNIGTVDVESVSVANTAAAVVNDAAVATGETLANAADAATSRLGGLFSSISNALSNVSKPVLIGAGVVLVAGVGLAAYGNSAGKRR